MRRELQFTLRLLAMIFCTSIGIAGFFTSIIRSPPLHQATFFDIFMLAFGMLIGTATAGVALGTFIGWVERNKRVR